MRPRTVLPISAGALSGGRWEVPVRYLPECLTFHGLRNTLEGTVARSCPLGRDLHAWRLLNLQPLAPLAALAGRPPKETIAQSRKHPPARWTAKWVPRMQDGLRMGFERARSLSHVGCPASPPERPTEQLIVPPFINSRCPPPSVPSFAS